MPAVIWIWVCVYLNLIGWVLAALHELNATGYSIALLIGFVVLWILKKENFFNFLQKLSWRKFSRRFHRPLPAIFLVVAALVFIGGILYAPNNYDALTYRLPRMMNWFVAGHWFWIPTINDRMNYSAPAWEWVAMPFLVLFHSDRGMFLINALGFLLMPGLLFSIFYRTGVARRAAWMWMWILPLAYGYATQAGGIGNDLTGALFAIASVFFGLRARRSGKIQDIWLSILAAALMTGIKLSNLPLLLPCLVAVWPALKQLRKNLIGSLAVGAIAAVVSSAPTIALNQMNAGNWTGDPKNSAQLQAKSPLGGLVGNGLLVLQQSLMPPVLPAAHKVGDWLNRKMPVSLHQMLEQKFPRYFMSDLNELPQEESAGLGLGITALLLANIIASMSWWRNSKAIFFSQTSLIGFSTWVAVLAYMFKMGSEGAGRLMLPYYPLVILPFLLLPSQEFISRLRVWNFFVLLAAISVLPAIILSPSRPLWPALSISHRLAQRHPANSTLQRFATVYSTYANRNDVLAPLRRALPSDVEKIGFVASSNDTSYSLWRPFGQRQVFDLSSDLQKSSDVLADIQWIVVKKTSWSQFSDVPLEKWADEHHAQIVLSMPIETFVSRGDETWCVLHIQN